MASKERYRVFLLESELDKLPDGIVVEQTYPAFSVVEVEEGEIEELKLVCPVERLEPTPVPPQASPSLASTLNITTERGPYTQQVQFKKPLPKNWQSLIESADCEVRSSLGEGAVVVYCPNKPSITKLEALEQVSFTEAFRPQINLDSETLKQIDLAEDLQDEAAQSKALDDAMTVAASHSEKPKSRNLSMPSTVVANFFVAEDAHKAERSLKRKGITNIKIADDYSLIINLSEVDSVAVALLEIAKRVGLRSLEEKKFKELRNNKAKEIIAGSTILPKPMGLGLTGKGEIIAVADTGLDTGNKITVHEDFRGRVKEIQSFPIAPSYADMVKNPGADDGAADIFSGHGTHVAGSAVGNGARAKALALLDPSVENIEGVAPEAELIFQAIEQTPKWKLDTVIDSLMRNIKLPPSTLFGIPDDLKILFNAAYEGGARIHCNSWGGGAQGAYEQQCFQLDEYVWNKKDFLVLVAAGNTGVDINPTGQGVDPNSIESPATAKNCITVGATENNRPVQVLTKYGDWWTTNFPKAPFNDNLMADNGDEIAAFSSRGPVNSGRRKPDVLAPGTFVISTRSSQMPINNFAWGSYPKAKSDYVYNGGTSMATPMIAGCAALIRQYLREEKSMDTPSAALLKAAIIHSAEYLDYPHLHPTSTKWVDNDQGWGRVNLEQFFENENFYLDDALGLQTGELREYRFDLQDNTVPLSITMVYNDFPGEMLINNLNLFAFSPENDFHVGNDFAGTGQVDSLNNVEGIRIEKPKVGEWSIRIIASEVPQPNQDFAVIVSGAGMQQIISL